MGSIGGCVQKCCCVGACKNEIAQIKLTLETGYSPLVFTRDVNKPLTQDCLEYLLAGDWANYLTDDKGTGSCSRLGTMRDCKITITHATPVNPLVFSCPRFDGSGWYPGSAKVQTTTLSDGLVHEYYWPSEIFANGYETGTYNGTAFTFQSGSHWNATNVCLSDVALAAAIKADLVTYLGSIYPEFASGAFSVAVERTTLTPDTPLGLYGQTVVMAGKCGGLLGSDCWNVTLTKSANISAAIVELTRNNLKVTLLQRHLKTMVVGTNCNTPPITTTPIDSVSDAGVSKVGFQLGLPFGSPAVECFSSYDFELTLPGFRIELVTDPKDFPTCDANGFSVVTGNADGSVDPVTINGRVELIYA
jgi:hypothetical protein